MVLAMMGCYGLDCDGLGDEWLGIMGWTMMDYDGLGWNGLGPIRSCQILSDALKGSCPILSDPI